MELAHTNEANLLSTYFSHVLVHHYFTYPLWGYEYREQTVLFKVYSSVSFDVCICAQSRRFHHPSKCHTPREVALLPRSLAPGERHLALSLCTSMHCLWNHTLRPPARVSPAAARQSHCVRREFVSSHGSVVSLCGSSAICLPCNHGGKTGIKVGSGTVSSPDCSNRAPANSCLDTLPSLG